MLAKKSPNPTDKHIGSRVRFRRMQLGMSQEKLGAALNLTFQQIQKYEKGVNRIGGSRMQQIAHALQVEPAFFFERAPGSQPVSAFAPSPAFVDDFLASSDGMALTRAFQRIGNSKMRRCIVNMVEQIADGEQIKRVEAA